MPIKEGSWLYKHGFKKVLNKKNINKANVEPIRNGGQQKQGE